MKQFLLFITLIILWSCGNKKSIQLPEIQNSNITEVTDVSPAYLFYNEKQPNSVELNRKNLISATNWLLNVDKRLTLKQVIPHIKFLQEKKRNAEMHKNENAKNYFTCNDTSIKNLGFIDFTDVVYSETENNAIDYPIDVQKTITFIRVDVLEDIKIQSTDMEAITTNSNELNSFLKKYLSDKIESGNLVLAFNQNLSFQDYITLKSILLSLKNESISISNEEFIY